MKPLVSVITVCYNAEQTIRDTFESVLRQTYSNIEYIVIDGNSTDETMRIIESYSEKFNNAGIEYRWVSEPDRGISDAFNKGLRLAKGDLIGLLNADDWYEDNTLEILVKSHQSVNKDFYYGNVNLCDKTKNTTRVLMGSPYFEQRVKYVMPINHPTMFATKRSVERTGLYSLDYKFAMDYDYVVRMNNLKLSGEYISNLFVNMRSGGAHYNNYLKTLFEVYEISVRNGGGRIKGLLLLVYTYINQRVIKIPIASYFRKLKLLK